MSNVGYATLTVIPSAKGFGKALGKGLDGPMRSQGKASGKALGGGVLGALKGFAGPLAAVFAGVEVFGFMKGAIAEAGNLEQSIGAIDSVFKESAGQMHEWSRTAATDVGLTRNEFNELGTLIGTQLKNGGTAMEELGPKTQELIGLGADLSSMFGGTTADAVGALSSALKGERDPIERFGVSLTQAAIDAEAAALGFDKVGGSLSAEANQAATLSLIMKQTSDAHGNFARETDTLAHQQQVLSAGWTDLSGKIGGLFVPALTGILTGVNTYVVPGLTRFVDGIAGVKAILTDGFSEEIREAFGWEEDSGIVVTTLRIRDALTGLRDLLVGGDFTGALTNAFGWEEDHPAVAGLLGLRDVVSEVFSAIGEAFSSFDFGALLAPMGEALSSIDFAAILGPIGDVLATLGPTLSEVAGPALEAILALNPLRILFEALAPVLPTLAEAIGTLATTLLGALTPLIPIIATVAVTLGQALTSAIAGLAPIIAMLIPIIADLLVGAFQALTPLIEMLPGLLEILLPPLLGLMPVVLQVIEALLPLVGVFAELVQTLLPPLIGLILAVVPPIVELVASVAEALVPVLELLAGYLGDFVVPILGVLIGWVGKVIGVILNLAGPIIGALVSALSTAIGWFADIIGWVADFFGNLGNVGEAIGNFKDTISDGISAVVDWFMELPGKIIDAISGLAGDLLEAGRNVIQGFIDGVKGMAGAVIDSIKSTITDSLPGFVKTALGIHSPSRLFRGFGQDTAAGMALGIRDGADAVADAADALVPSAPSIRAPEVSGGGVMGALSAGGGAPLVGSLTLQSNGDVRDDLEEALFHLRRTARGGVF